MNNNAGCTDPRPTREAHEVPDTDLIRRIGAGDQQAFEQLYNRYYHYLFRFIYRMTRRLESTEEIINDVMLVVWEKAANLELTSRASTWILSIAYRKSLKSLDQYRANYADVSVEDIEYDLPSDDEATMKQLELTDWVLVALESVSREQRTVVELAYFHGMRYSDIADVMGCPESTVKTRMFHARKKLRSLLPSLIEGAHPGQSQGSL
ncbi:MAG: RNA polymerase sigma factor [Gammaproteobacteria bacterium]